jgi:hypothetical protein
MKRNEIAVGQVLAHAASNDWADQGQYSIREVTVADTRGWVARRYNSYNNSVVTLEDGTETAYFSQADGKPNVLVHDKYSGLKLVPLAQLRGDYAVVMNTVQARTRVRQQQERQREAAKATNRQRVQDCAAALAAAGVPLGFVSGWDENLELGPAALEAIVALIQGTPRVEG